VKAVVYDWYTDVFPTENEIREFCLIGKGAETCIWLLVGVNGFECSCLHKPYALLERWEKGLTVAKRNGCEKVKNFNPSEMDGEVQF
jgi:hypothetical protein